MSSPTTPQNPLSALLAAELALFLPVLDNFFASLQQPNVNTQAVAQDAGKALLAATQNLPQAETTGINVAAAAAQQQLHTLVNQANGLVTPSTPPAGAVASVPTPVNAG